MYIITGIPMERVSDGYKQSSMVLNEWIIVLSSFYSLIQSMTTVLYLRD